MNDLSNKVKLAEGKSGQCLKNIDRMNERLDLLLTKQKQDFDLIANKNDVLFQNFMDSVQNTDESHASIMNEMQIQRDVYDDQKQRFTDLVGNFSQLKQNIHSQEQASDQ